MMMSTKLMREDIRFIHNLTKLYPEENSHAKRTKRLNKVLEEMLYGTK